MLSRPRQVLISERQKDDHQCQSQQAQHERHEEARPVAGGRTGGHRWDIFRLRTRSMRSFAGNGRACLMFGDRLRLNIYTYEIDHQSKASKIFISKKFDFEDEDILQAELLAYFLSSKACGPNAQLIRDLIKPLPFDPAREGEYLAALRSDRYKIPVLDELESLYEDVCLSA